MASKVAICHRGNLMKGEQDSKLKEAVLLSTISVPIQLNTTKDQWNPKEKRCFKSQPVVASSK